MAWAIRAIKSAPSVCHNTVINWVKFVNQTLPDEDEILQTAQVDELQTFVGSKKSKSGNGIAYLVSFSLVLITFVTFVILLASILDLDEYALKIAGFWNCLYTRTIYSYTNIENYCF